jgi:hypothetical protein
MIQHLIGGSVFWLNAFPSDQGISNSMSPWTIMTGKAIDFVKHCKIMFGTYAQVHEEHDNSLLARTTGAIALRPTGNNQGGYYFMSLTTGRILNRNHWHELPMPQDVVDRVHKLARQSYATKDLVFQFRDGATVDEDDESAADPDYEPNDNESIDDGTEYDTDTEPDEMIVPIHDELQEDESINNDQVEPVVDEDVPGVAAADQEEHDQEGPDNEASSDDMELSTEQNEIAGVLNHDDDSEVQDDDNEVEVNVPTCR